MDSRVNNLLMVTGPEDDVQRFKAVAVGRSPWDKPTEDEKPNVLNFHNLLPVPEAVLLAGYADAGRNWERQHWGCYRGACGSTVVDVGKGRVTYEFDTTGSPPIEFLVAISRQWPGLTFILEYREPVTRREGVARFHGEAHEDSSFQW